MENQRFVMNLSTFFRLVAAILPARFSHNPTNSPTNPHRDEVNEGEGPQPLVYRRPTYIRIYTNVANIAKAVTLTRVVFQNFLNLCLFIQYKSFCDSEIFRIKDVP